MSETIMKGWLKNKSGEKFAPKTLLDQVVDADGEDLTTKLDTIVDSYTELLKEKSDIDHNHEISDVSNLQTVLDSNLAESKSYTDSKTTNIITTSTVDEKISSHNTSTSAHDDIRVLITDLKTKLNNFLDVDDTTTDQLSEVLTLIENNKGTLESLTTSKVNVSDIIDNLTTNVSNKPLSAAQGVAIKTLIDTLDAALDTKADVHDHPYLSSSTTYALSDTVGGSALSSQKMSITRMGSLITDIAASLDVRTEAVYFGGSDAVSIGGCPATYCIVNIKKGDNHRTILDCYHLNTGDHYINGCMDTRDTTSNPWTGWVKQPTVGDIDSINTYLSNIVNGTTVVAKAENSENAENAEIADTALLAETASKLGSANIGSSYIPIYLESGAPKEISYVEVKHGGTGATTTANARSNLSVYSKSEVGNLLGNQYSYGKIGVVNYTSSLAASPDTGDGTSVLTTDIVNSVIPNDTLFIKAGSNLITFEIDDSSTQDSDCIIVNINADPVGSADAALEDAKAYTDSMTIAITNEEIDEICSGMMTEYLNSIAAEEVSF